MKRAKRENANDKNEVIASEVIAGLDQQAFAAAVQREAYRRLELFADGVTNYQHFPRAERHEGAPEVWREGSTRLLNFGAYTKKPNAPPVLVIPSLINRSHILDLSPDRSLMRHLAASGFHPFLIDWGTPGEKEKTFGLTDYISGPLQRAFEFVHNHTNTRPALVGYCMGGLLALALTQRNLANTTALALLATPWDFHSGQNAAARYLKAIAPGLNALIENSGVLPADILQAMFANLEPGLTGSKFRRFATLPKGSPQADRFVTLEDWLNDGVPLAGPVARQCLFEWYLENTPAKGNWKVGGDTIDPGQLTLPSFVAIPRHDHIVPPASAQALADALPSAHALKPGTGHIGMIAGEAAPKQLYIPLTDWLSRHLD